MSTWDCPACYRPPPPDTRSRLRRFANWVFYRKIELKLWLRAKLGFYVWNGSVYTCLHSNPGCESCLSPALFRFTRQYPLWVKWDYWTPEEKKRMKEAR